MVCAATTACLRVIAGLIGTPPAADRYGMDPLSSVRAASSQAELRLIESRAADAAPWAPDLGESSELPNAASSAVPVAGTRDPADEQQQKMLHLMSHVDADCFISLLQITDPMPQEWQARAEYKRHYRQLRDVLTVPAQDPEAR